MPAKSEKQRRFFGMIYNAKKTGKVNQLSGDAKKTAENISKKDARDFAKKSTHKEDIPNNIAELISDDLNYNNGLIDTGEPPIIPKMSDDGLIDKDEITDRIHGMLGLGKYQPKPKTQSNEVVEHEPQHSMDPGTGDDDGW